MLYMPALAAIRVDPTLGRKYEALPIVGSRQESPSRP